MSKMKRNYYGVCWLDICMLGGVSLSKDLFLFEVAGIIREIFF